MNLARLIGRLSPAFVAIVVTLLSAQSVRADDEFDLSVASGKIVVTAKGGWHINKAYPWRLTIGETKLDSSKFALSDTSASIDAPKGDAKLRGGVCNGDKCKTFEKSVTVP